MQPPIKTGQQLDDVDNDGNDPSGDDDFDEDDDEDDDDYYDDDDDDDDDNDVGRMQIERELQTPAIVFTSQCKGAPIA